MKWYHYIASFFAGVFLANVVPHFINGVSGTHFPLLLQILPAKGFLRQPLMYYGAALTYLQDIYY